MQFERKWKDFKESDGSFTYIYLDDKNGYLASKDIDQSSQLCMFISPYLPYWLAFRRQVEDDATKYLEVGEKDEEKMERLTKRVKYFFGDYEMISLKVSACGWDHLLDINIGSVLFGRFIGERIIENRF